MSTRLAIISDTHVPGREAEVPDWVLTRVERADHVIHAGDFDAPETVAELRGRASKLTAVAGNIDPPTIDLPDVATVTVDDVTFVVVHGTGPHDSWPERVAGVVADATGSRPVVGVAGHTHTPTDVVVDGIRLLNPGSATGARPASHATMCTADVDVDRVDVTFHEA